MFRQARNQAGEGG